MFLHKSVANHPPRFVNALPMPLVPLSKVPEELQKNGFAMVSKSESVLDFVKVVEDRLLDPQRHLDYGSRVACPFKEE